MKFKVTKYAVFKKEFIVEAEDENDAIEKESPTSYAYSHDLENETEVEEVTK